MEYIFPSSLKVNRGRRNLDELFRIAEILKSDVLLLTNVNKGNPSSIEVFDVSSRDLLYHFLIKSLRLKSDYDKANLANNKRELCIKDTVQQCFTVNSFLVDLGAKRGKCETIAVIWFENECKIKFMNKGDELLTVGLES
ncbi:hypothetical protein [Metallosphaera hakonensis]|uniref:Brix domain-containing protein n=1 Tax=Metallosphaera hakonensis JCM 8857 = DSM 7519 TaxID=1293036 RepID=A0A2U9ITM9_9CREN|nr:hypothetical protein [Metallosphaera hakonensis]